ncbi:MAG: hypothetical protein JHC26_12670 [Thermofilum sp.]|jgi:hypothetical protein|uniref:hypothetical protein n=1 Tax=Thermofilum sp. TaxID=1961369 RepID=UPI00258E85A6|nr:hypothetical protein [Thermofilum sp.]MCI4409939.1 hypothetical protein [Thermofilum sp.]
MPKYRLEIEVENQDELRKLLFPQKEETPRGIYGFYITMAKSAITSACQQIVNKRMDIGGDIIKGVMQELAQARQRAVLIPEEEEISQAIKILKELADKLKGADQTRAVEFCCDWLGKTECP